MSDQRTINIDPISAQSLMLRVSVNSHFLSSATGFIVEKGRKNYLITNWHVVSGRDPYTNQPLSPTAGIPDTIQVTMHAKQKLDWRWKHEQPLFDTAGDKLWIEHPMSQKVDVVALELKDLQADIQIYPFDLGLGATDLLARPAMPISIVGFPLGLSAGGKWPIWKTGHVATDPDIDYDDQPNFLIDATTRPGMSGSPVIVRTSIGYSDSKGNFVLGGGVKTKFMGIYSGRINDLAEIGRVWRPEVIESIFGS